ncbi:response regulator [Roseomonas xinghualingensis]|uniref:response regulator n=1 Tax=Roseomonas xinghualingensis TaxID=2986475 RepID=UPI0021F1D291|nr:response regulator [Roseomonas sp. SXEYE001]MCV4208803.1 response regulator [Roseomonas sp. SXEYE001]
MKPARPHSSLCPRNLRLNVFIAEALTQASNLVELERPMPGVVVLEDDELVREVLTDIIEAEGFTVRPAATVGDAIAQIDSMPRCELLLTDIDLGPGPSGFDAAKVVQERHPCLPVIYLTGRPDHANDRHFGPRERFLRKPFRTPELVDAMRSLGVHPPAQSYAAD